MWILDDGTRVGFAHIHSHGTVAHPRNDPRLAVSVVDILQRRGIIIRGVARISDASSATSDDAAELYRERRGSVPSAVLAYVLADITGGSPPFPPLTTMAATPTPSRHAGGSSTNASTTQHEFATVAHSAAVGAATAIRCTTMTMIRLLRYPGEIASLARLHAQSRRTTYAGILSPQALARIEDEEAESTWGTRAGRTGPRSRGPGRWPSGRAVRIRDGHPRG